MTMDHVFRRSSSISISICLVRFCHFGSKPHNNTCSSSVAILWDLDNKPPNSIPPFDAAIKLSKAASLFGTVRFMLAYANHHAFRHHIPPPSPLVRNQNQKRKAMDQLENRGVIRPAQPSLCPVCGRKFYHHYHKLLNHFHQIHHAQHTKRLNQLESARGNQRLQLLAKFSMKMDKYNNAARNIFTLNRLGYGLADELKRAGFSVNLVSNKPQAAHTALRNRMLQFMDNKQVDCLLLVSNHSDFTHVFKEARLRCLKTVIVGDNNDGALKRCADAAFSWKEIMLGKAKKDAVSVLGRWKDRDVLNRLEWTYRPDFEDFDSSEFENEDMFQQGQDLANKEDVRPW